MLIALRLRSTALHFYKLKSGRKIRAEGGFDEVSFPSHSSLFNSSHQLIVGADEEALGYQRGQSWCRQQGKRHEDHSATGSTYSNLMFLSQLFLVLLTFKVQQLIPIITQKCNSGPKSSQVKKKTTAANRLITVHSSAAAHLALCVKISILKDICELSPPSSGHHVYMHKSLRSTI